MRIIRTEIYNKNSVMIGDNMDYNKIFTDFEKRYGEKCEAAFFVGKPIIFFGRTGMTSGCSVSVGGCIALSRRQDERIEVQFSGNTDLVSCSRLNFKYNRQNEIINLLFEMEKYGVKTGGANIFMFYNTELESPLYPMFFSAMGSFCKNTPNPHDAAKHFDDFEKNMICLSSKKEHITVFDGQRPRYFPFPENEVKIVLSYVGEPISVKNTPEDGTANDGISALSAGDWEKFGYALDKEGKELIARNGLKRIKNLFESAKEIGDAYGSGILEDGGIFSVVKNSRIDAFMHNLGARYEKYFGGCPEFYVTRPEDSGIRVENQ